MSFEALLIDDVTVFNPGSELGTDRYGNPVVEFDGGTTVLGRVQSASDKELLDGRDTTLAWFKVFLPAGTVVTAYSMLSWEGRDLRVDGTPDVFKGRYAPHHIELMAQEVKG